VELLVQQVVHVKELLEHAFEVFALKAHHHRVTLRFILAETLPIMIVDRALFARALHVVIDRALAVTIVGGVIVRARRTAGEVVIGVDDSGPWVSPRDVPRLFLPGSTDPDLLVAADLARRLCGTLTASGGSEHYGLRVKLIVPLLPEMAQHVGVRE
jgi:signal transduction histidine kinase